MKAVDLQQLLRKKILELEFFYENIANGLYCGIHNIPKSGKYAVIGIQYNWIDYDLYFDSKENCQEFIRLIPQLDVKIQFNSTSTITLKNV